MRGIHILEVSTLSGGTLGLDLGTNSIGWALVDHDAQGQPTGLVACGVRIFQEAVDLKTRTPKNQARREARQARRLTARRRMRRQTLTGQLISCGMLPEDDQERVLLLTRDGEGNPYLLRKRGLDEALSLHEFGRVLFHLNQRRGFKSNRKAQLGELLKDPEVAALVATEEAGALAAKSPRRAGPRGGADKEESIIKAAITALHQAIEQSGSRTLGEYLWGQSTRRGIHTDRSMYESEFEALWESQQTYHPNALTDELRAEIFRTMFHQRPLRTQKFLVARCRLEPSRRRAPKALLEFQRFRILQDASNLRIKDPRAGDWRALTAEETQTLTATLCRQESLKWSKARQLLHLHRSTEFNLEAGGLEQLTGDRTSHALRRALGANWDALDEEKRKALVTDLLTIDRKDALYRRLRGPAWQFSAEEAYRLAIAELEPGYATFSLKAMRRILPYLEDGREYSDALTRAGYRSPGDALLALRELPEPPMVRNPVVQKALVEVRKVVNTLLRTHGFPNRICVELARDMKLTRKEKDRQQRQNKDNQRANQEATVQLYELGMIAGPNPALAKREDLLKYRLWKECGGECPYTGQSIGINILFSPDVDIEHILPYSRSLDDSYMNKTLCMATFNRLEKKAQTPYEVFSGNPELYETVLQRVRHMTMKPSGTGMPLGKLRRFELRELDVDRFVARQLSDTRYISLAVRDYLAVLGVPVEVSRGEATAALRHNWGLSRLLPGEGTDADDASKNRSDHRHHAIDAIVVALTSRRLFQQLSRLSATSSQSLREGLHLDLPWIGFLDEVADEIERVVVSHAPRHKIVGALHEETVYGYDKENGCFVSRKPLESLKSADVDKIRDPVVRALVSQRIAQCDGNLSKALGDKDHPVLHKDGRTPILSVRLTRNLNMQSMAAISDVDQLGHKFVKLGNNHHVEIIEHTETHQRKGVFVSAMEAARRARRARVPIVQRVGPWMVDGQEYGTGWVFVMSLSVNDLMEVPDGDGTAIYRVQKLDGPGKKITLCRHNVATVDGTAGRLIKTPNTLTGYKVSVNAIGALGS